MHLVRRFESVEVCLVPGEHHGQLRGLCRHGLVAHDGFHAATLAVLDEVRAGPSRREAAGRGTAVGHADRRSRAAVRRRYSAPDRRRPAG